MSRNWDTQEKSRIRSIVCSGGPYSKIMLLPGNSCLDLIELYNKGLINKRAEVFIVERDTETMKLIKERLASPGIWTFYQTTFTFIQKDVSKIVLADYNIARTKFDLIYLDTCGHVCTKMLEFLSRLSRDLKYILKPTGRLAFNFSLWMRDSVKFEEALAKFDNISGREQILTNCLKNLFSGELKTYTYRNPDSPYTMLTAILDNPTPNKPYHYNSLNFKSEVKNTFTPSKMMIAGQKAAKTKKSNEERIARIEVLLEEILTLLKGKESPMIEAIQTQVKNCYPAKKYSDEVCLTAKKMQDEGIPRKDICKKLGIPTGSFVYLTKRVS